MGPINDETFPSWATVHMHLKQTEKGGAIKFNWYEGKIGNNGKENKGIKKFTTHGLFSRGNP